MHFDKITHENLLNCTPSSWQRVPTQSWCNPLQLKRGLDDSTSSLLPTCSVLRINGEKKLCATCYSGVSQQPLSQAQTHISRFFYVCRRTNSFRLGNGCNVSLQVCKLQRLLLRAASFLCSPHLSLDTEGEIYLHGYWPHPHQTSTQRNAMQYHRWRRGREGEWGECTGVEEKQTPEEKKNNKLKIQEKTERERYFAEPPPPPPKNDANIVTQQPFWDWSAQNVKENTKARLLCVMCRAVRRRKNEFLPSLRNDTLLFCRQMAWIHPEHFFFSFPPPTIFSSKVTTRRWTDRALLLAICLSCMAPEHEFPVRDLSSWRHTFD